MATRLTAAVTAVYFLLGTGLCTSQSHAPQPRTAVVVSAPPTAEPATPTPAEPTPVPTPTPLPASVFIKVPYTPQAPTGNWDSAHEEYCEAAAVLMVGRYFRGDTRSVIPPPEAETAMAQLVAWERSSFPRVLDLPLNEIGQVGQQFYSLTPVIEPATLDNVKHEIAAGRPVIIPVMTHGAPGGQKIAPFYGKVSVYHVILITGYDASKVYTNDAGFTQGQNYAYDWPILESAMDAQAPKMNQGRILLVYKPS